MNFNEGDRIIYQHPHHLNSSSVTTLVKTGVFIRYVKQNYRNMGRPAQAVVQMDGNKGVSTVNVHQLRKEQ